MPIIAFHLDVVVEFVLATAWIMAAVFYYRSLYAAGKTVLRPIRLYGMHVSMAWALWYFILFTDVFNEAGWWEQNVVHNIGNGLMIATVVYFFIISFFSVKLLSKLGIE